MNPTHRRIRNGMATRNNAVIDRWKEHVGSDAADAARLHTGRISLRQTILNGPVAGFVHGRRVLKWPKGPLSGFTGSFSHEMAQRFGDRGWSSTRAYTLAARMQNSMWDTLRTPVHSTLERTNP